MNRNTIDAAAMIDGASSGSVTCTEGARPRRAEHARRLLAPRVEVRPEPADRPHDHGEVEEDVRDEHRRDAPLPVQERERPPGRSSARNAVATTTVGSTNGTVTNARNSRRPGKS